MPFRAASRLVATVVVRKRCFVQYLHLVTAAIILYTVHSLRAMWNAIFDCYYQL
jgi:hypothetical protein